MVPAGTPLPPGWPAEYLALCECPPQPPPWRASPARLRCPEGRQAGWHEHNTRFAAYQQGYYFYRSRNDILTTALRTLLRTHYPDLFQDEPHPDTRR